LLEATTHLTRLTLAVISPTRHETAKTASLPMTAPWPRLRSRFGQGFNVLRARLSLSLTAALLDGCFEQPPERSTLYLNRFKLYL